MAGSQPLTGHGKASLIQELTGTGRGEGDTTPRQIVPRLPPQAVSRLPVALAAMPITAATLHLRAALRRGAASRHLPAAASVARRRLGEAEDSPAGMEAAVSPVHAVAVVSPADAEAVAEGDKQSRGVPASRILWLMIAGSPRHHAGIHSGVLLSGYQESWGNSFVFR